MSEAKQPGAFARAEEGSRRIVMTLGLGVAAYAVGRFLSGGVLTRLEERGAGVESEALAFVLGWLLARLWLFLVLPAIGFTMGRLLEVRPFRFAVTAALAGEIFSGLLITAGGGFEMLVPTPGDGLARGLTLLLGIGLTQLATSRGVAAAGAAQARANAQAAEHAAELDALAKRAAGLDSGTAPTEPPGPRP